MHGFGFSSKTINYKLDIDIEVINTNDVVYRLVHGIIIDFNIIMLL